MEAVKGNNDMIQIYKAGFGYMLMIMRIDDDQAFKICIEFFHFFIGSYLEMQGKNLQGMMYNNNNSNS
jgi:hypothetical protein